jgi:hypothetical protein
MTKWLDAMAADNTHTSPPAKVKHKPAEAVDACWDSSGKKIAEVATFDGREHCNTL